jgi:hypothetical protein
MNVRVTTSCMLLANAFWASGAAAASNRTMDDVAEAVFRQQMSLWVEGNAGDSQTVLCLAIERDNVPEGVSREFLQRFKTQGTLRSRGECDARKEGAIEPTTGRPAILVTVGAMKWLSADEAEVTVHHFRSQRISGTRSYRVVRERSRWICLGQVIEMAPA